MQLWHRPVGTSNNFPMMGWEWLVYIFKQKSAPKKNMTENPQPFSTGDASPFGVMLCITNSCESIRIQLFGVIKARESSRHGAGGCWGFFEFFQRFCCLRFHLVFSSSDLCHVYIHIYYNMYDRYVFFNLSPHGELSPSPHHALEDMLPLPVRIVSLFPGWNLALRYSMKSSYKNHEFRDGRG